MAVFNDFLTTEGERLLARSLMGEAQITFTRMEIGDGEQAITNRNITALSNKRMELDIYSVNLSGNVITVTSILDSKDIVEGFYFREKGLYATDGTNEILMIYANCGSLADWIDNINVAVFTRQLRSIITFTESDNINITLQDGLYASTNDIHELEANMQAMINNIKLEGDWSTYEQVNGFIALFNQFMGWYTQSRAGKIDNMDALVSSRAPASTALSTATWTNARAALLDNLDAKISSRAAASTALSNGVWTDARASYIDIIPGISNNVNVINNRTKGMDITKLMSGTIKYQTLGESTIISHNGGGVLHGIIADFKPSTIGHIFKIRIIIDGIEVLSNQSDSTRTIRFTSGFVRADTLGTSEGSSSLETYAYCPTYSSISAFKIPTYNGDGAITTEGIMIVPEPIAFKSSIAVIAYLSTTEYAATISYQLVKD